MKSCIVILGALLLLAVQAAHATQPCIYPNRQWLFDNVINKSDLAVYGKIVDYSDIGHGYVDKKWTEIRIIKVLYGKTGGSNKLIIHGWQANDFPLYVHSKDDFAVFWLKKDKGEYYVTDLNWSKCVPSIWNAWDGGIWRHWAEVKVSNPLMNGYLSLKKIENWIAKSTQNKGEANKIKAF